MTALACDVIELGFELRSPFEGVGLVCLAPPSETHMGSPFKRHPCRVSRRAWIDAAPAHAGSPAHRRVLRSDWRRGGAGGLWRFACRRRLADRHERGRSLRLTVVCSSVTQTFRGLARMGACRRAGESSQACAASRTATARVPRVACRRGGIRTPLMEATGSSPSCAAPPRPAGACPRCVGFARILPRSSSGGWRSDRPYCRRILPSEPRSDSAWPPATTNRPADGDWKRRARRSPRTAVVSRAPSHR
jgi:hypothetical protein